MSTSEQTNSVRKHILAISGSLRKDSSNTRILQSFAEQIPEHIGYEIYDGLADLPHFNPLLDTEEPPESVHHFRGLLKKASAVIMCSPEYAFGVPGSLKNALDWTVTSGDFVEKPVAVIVAASVGEHAYASLLLSLGAINAHILEDGKLLIPFIRSKMNAEGQVTDEATIQQLKAVLDAVIDSVS